MINASEADSGVRMIQAAAKSRRPLRLIGVWRLWPEHALGAPEAQGRPVVARWRIRFPDHVFEIHPVTMVGGLSLLDSFHPVEGLPARSGEADPWPVSGRQTEAQSGPDHGHARHAPVTLQRSCIS
jgi:hypothetical protein